VQYLALRDSGFTLDPNLTHTHTRGILKVRIMVMVMVTVPARVVLSRRSRDDGLEQRDAPGRPAE
jgi:hypothetical protein